ncbi:MAG: response regulator [Flavobacteriales bacterium]|nr:response regulator [Flavobacteriales bacterium]
MKKLSCIIIDDENPARGLVKAFLSKKGGLELVAEANNGFDAVKLIDDLKPELVFLDIQMPKLNGFEVLELIKHKPKVIFTTAYDNYAIKAFEENAVDYLLKPFSFDRFSKAIDRVVVDDNNSVLDDNHIDVFKSISRIVVKEGSSIQVIQNSDINYIQSNDDYVIINSKKGEYVKNKTMNYFEEVLPSAMFLRIHRSIIINIYEIKSLIHIAKENYEIELIDGSRHRISKSNIKRVKELIS